MVVWKLKDLLAAHDIAPYRLARESGMHAPSVYRMLRGTGTKAVTRETLATIISALRTLTGKSISVCDLLEYVEELPF
jgi:DNA-binding Xre family transcriptional regulator